MDGKRSWLGSDWALGDGSATILTPIDPLFIYLALITEATMTKDGAWRFVDIDSLQLDSCENMDAASTGVLLGMANVKSRALEALCEVKEVSGDMCVARIDKAKVMGWLRRKCDISRFPRCLEGGVKDISATDEKLAEEVKAHEMVLLVSEYLPRFWHDSLLAEFGGFARVCQREKEISRVQAVSFDSPESYTLGVAPPSATAKPAKVEKAKTAKEKQLEKAAKNSKSITSFFKKKTA
ncbi:hypothetical protein GQ54DRAFT_294813 [Martensiomyces pterosporus]|nr:hypothetical protein GQ54DRAFT_294813 [Martensiomyces pterosporus]